VIGGLEFCIHAWAGVLIVDCWRHLSIELFSPVNRGPEGFLSPRKKYFCLVKEPPFRDD